MVNNLRMTDSLPYEGNERFADSAPPGVIRPPKPFSTRVDEYAKNPSVSGRKKLAHLNKIKGQLIHDLKVHGAATLILAGAAAVIGIATASAVCFMPALFSIFAGGSTAQDLIDLRITNRAISQVLNRG